MHCNTSVLGDTMLDYSKLPESFQRTKQIQIPLLAEKSKIGWSRTKSSHYFYDPC